MPNEHKRRINVSLVFGILRKMRRAVLGLLLMLYFVACLAPNMAPVLAHSGSVLSAWASTPPTIDATIEIDEWADADSMAYTTTGGPTGDVSGVFYVMNDAANLYIAVTTTDSTLSTDTTVYDNVLVYFDNDNDGLGPEAGDDIIGWHGYQGEGFRDGFSDGTYVWYKDANYGGTSEGSAAATNHGAYNHFEVSHPLDTIDDDHDFDLVPGGTTSQGLVGFTMKVIVDGDDKGWWPSYDLIEWHDIFVAQIPMLSAWASMTPTIDGEIHLTTALSNHYTLLLRGEWGDAATADFRFVSSAFGEVHDATVYVKNDYINLYLALVIRDEDYNGDLDDILFSFDNNNNGVREVGDNVLHVSGYRYYLDKFISDATEGTVTADDYSGGTFEGVGGACFTDEVDYHFEIAYPLDTLDNTHDFSLSIGETVGFNIEFGEWGNERDTWPSKLWHEMAEIHIAAPPYSPPPPTADLRIFFVEVTQAIQTLPRLPLVRNKATVARVIVDIGPVPGPVSVGVYLFGFRYGHFLGALSQFIDAPSSADRDLGDRTHTANFLLPLDWVGPVMAQEGYLTLRAFVKGTDPTLVETDYSNNWMADLSTTFYYGRTPTVWVIPVNLGTRGSPDMMDPSTPVGNLFITTREEYLRTVFPAEDVNFIRLPWDMLGESQPNIGDRLNNRLTRLFYRLGTFRYEVDQIFGVTPRDTADAGGMSDPKWLDGEGCASSGHGPGDIMAHEIDHNLDWSGSGTWGRHTPGAPGPDPNWPYPNNQIQEYGVDTSAGIRIVDHATTDFMSYDPRPAWISPYRWEKLFTRFNDGITSASMTIQQVESNQSLMISGWVSQNGTGSLDPVFSLPGTRESSSIQGNYSLVLKDNVGNILLAHSFQPSFTNVEGGIQDPDYFTKLLPYHDGTTEVALMYENTALDEIQMSPNAPTVEILSPTGGEVWQPDVQTITWTGDDADNDPLAYCLYYSADGGNTWMPISPTITETSYQIDASVLQGSQSALIRAVASDGFNIGQGESPQFFTVTHKPPTARIVQPEDEYQFSTNDVILLRGRGTDADDIILQPTAYNWTSNLDGYLGNGTTITTMLMLGTHQIILTVTDSQGNTASDTIIITVTLDAEITSVNQSKTVVGQGFSMHINVGVENRGFATQTFNVTAMVSNTTHVTEVYSVPTEVTLPPGNSTTLLFTWNATGLAKGNYDVSAEAALAEYVFTRFSNTIIIVAMPCDIAGSTTTPPAPSDGRVDYKDLFWLLKAYGSDPNEPNWNSDVDLAGSTTTPPAPPDNKVDYKDLYWMLLYYGQTDP